MHLTRGRGTARPGIGGPGPPLHPVRVKTSASAASVSSTITTTIVLRRAGVIQSIAVAAASVAIRVCIHRRCTGPGIWRMALAISLRPRRSAIRMVAEFPPWVDFKSRVRNPAGTSSTERNTWSVPLAEISTVEV